MAHRRRVLAILIAGALLFTAGCKDDSASGRQAPKPSSVIVDEKTGDANGAEPDPPLVLEALADAGASALDASTGLLDVLSAKAIGHTSVAFRLKASNGDVFAWKPASKRGRARYRSEVAAFALAQMLGCEANVPRGAIRGISRAALANALAQDPRGKDLFATELREDATLFGAAIPWIDHLEFLPLETPEERAVWGKWLGGFVPSAPSQRQRARELATLFVFDAISGNWDRMSGANIGYDRAHDRLLFVDNDAAFFEPLSTELSTKSRAPFEQVRLFPEELVARLRIFTLADFELQLRRLEGDEQVALLTRGQLASVERRRKEVLFHVETLLREKKARLLAVERP